MPSAFATSAIGDDAEGPPIVALASLYVEPAWLFLREGFGIDERPGSPPAPDSVGVAAGNERLVELTRRRAALRGRTSGSRDGNSV